MPTLTSTQSATLTVGAFESVTMVTGQVGKATIAFTSQAPNVHPDVRVSEAQPKTYGPYGVPMTCVITCLDGSVSYTQNGSQSDPLWADADGKDLKKPNGDPAYISRWSDSTGTAQVRPDGSTVALGGGGPAPLSGPSLVAFLGDSITANGFQTTANVGSYRAAGFSTWAMAFSMGALWCPLVWEIGNATPMLKYNRAVTGETAAQVAARITEIDALPVKPRFCGVLAGTNNLTINTSQTATSIVAEIVGICAALLQRGITPVLCTLLPRGNGTAAGWGALTSGQITTARGRLMEINRQLRGYAAGTPGVVLADVWSSIVNWDSATSDPLVTYAADYLHPSPPGAIRIGQAWWQAVAPFVAPGPDTAMGGGDTWNAAENPFGSQINSAFATSGGTAGAGTSGTVPNGWTANRFAGSTSEAVIAQQARADGKSGFEATIAMTGNDTAAFRLYEGGSTLTNANFSAGDAWYVEGDVVFNGTGASQYANPDFECRVSGSAVTAWAAANVGFAEGDVQGAYTFRLRTPLIQVPVGGMTGTNNVWTWDGIRSGGSATVTRRNIVLRKYNKTAPGAVTW